MKLVFAAATDPDAAPLAALRIAVAEDLARQFGQGHWSPAQTKAGVLRQLQKPKFSRILIARTDSRIIGTLHLALEIGRASCRERV